MIRWSYLAWSMLALVSAAFCDSDGFVYLLCVFLAGVFAADFFRSVESALTSKEQKH